MISAFIFIETGGESLSRVQITSRSNGKPDYLSTLLVVARLTVIPLNLRIKSPRAAPHAPVKVWQPLRAPRAAVRNAAWRQQVPQEDGDRVRWERKNGRNTTMWRARPGSAAGPVNPVANVGSLNIRIPSVWRAAAGNGSVRTGSQAAAQDGVPLKMFTFRCSGCPTLLVRTRL